MVQMAYLAEDTLGHSKETILMPYNDRMPTTTNNTLQEQLDYFDALSWEVCMDLYFYKVAPKLNLYSDCFENGRVGMYVIVTEKGRR